MTESLVKKYQPRRIEDFLGLAPIKAMLGQLVASPYSSAWLLMGNPGTGKSSIGMIAAQAIASPAGVHHLKSADSSVENIRKLMYDCSMAPMTGGRWHVAICEEAGSIGPAAQKAWLSELDTLPEDAIAIFTANPYVIDAKGRMTPHTLKDRFLGRVRTLNFTEPSLEDLAAFLERVWRAETGVGKRGSALIQSATKPQTTSQTKTRQVQSFKRKRHDKSHDKPDIQSATDRGKTWEQPDFAAIARSAKGSIRSALLTLETEILVPGSFVPEPERKQAIALVPSMDHVVREIRARGDNQRLREKAIKLKQQGLSLKDIASKIGAPASSVWRWTHAA